MALQFNPGAYYQPWALRQQQEQQDRQNQFTSLDTLGKSIIEGMNQKRQFDMLAIQQQQEKDKQDQLNWERNPHPELNTPYNNMGGASGNAMPAPQPLYNSSPMGLNASTMAPESPKMPVSGPNIGGFGQGMPTPGQGGSTSGQSQGNQNPTGMNTPTSAGGVKPLFSGVPDFNNRSPREIAFLVNRSKMASEMQANQYAGPQAAANYAKTLAEAQEHMAKSRTSGIKPPANYRWTTDMTGLEAIPGGPADEKERAKLEKENLAISGQAEKAKLILGKIDEALGQVGMTSAGAGALTKSIPMTPAMDLSTTLDTINSLLGFEQLGEMKNQTRTGASGLGQLSDREMQLLISARTSLKQGQSPDLLKKRLNELKTHFNNWLQMQKGINPYGNKKGTGMTQPKQNTDPLGLGL